MQKPIYFGQIYNIVVQLFEMRDIPERLLIGFLEPHERKKRLMGFPHGESAFR